jgi:hypothetical protein
MTTDTKISQLYSVNELGEGGPVEVWLYKGRIVIRAYNCSGNEHTNIDLEHLMDCLNQHLLNSVSARAAYRGEKE